MDKLGVNGWQLLIQLIAFIAFIWLLWKFAAGPIVNVLDQRQKKISDSLLAAERVQAEMRETQAKNEAALADSRREAQELLTSARQNAEQIVKKANDDAALAADEQLKRAQETLRQETAQARLQLRQEVADLAVVAAGKIIRKEINPSDQRALIEETLSGASSGRRA